jgi:hypothetical protein
VSGIPKKERNLRTKGDRSTPLLNFAKPIAGLWSASIILGCVVATTAPVMADPQYIVRLNNFKVFDTTSPHTDTDYIYLTVRVGDQIFGPRHVGLGDLNNGVFYVNWEVGPVTISDTTKILISYQIVNNGTADEQKQLANDAQIAGVISNVIAGGGAILDIFVPGSGPVASAIGQLVNEVGDAIMKLGSLIDCDEVVVSDTLGTDGKQIRQWLVPTGFHTEVRNYHTPGRPGPFCRDAHYAVSWSVLPSYARIDNRNSHLSMDVANASLLNGAAVNQFTTQNGANQRWHFVPVDPVEDPNHIAIISESSGKALDVPNGSHDSGVFIQQYSAHMGPNQRWRFLPAGDNASVQIVGENSGLALDVPGFSTAPGIGIQQYQPNNGTNQQWVIVPNPVNP